MTIQAIYFQLKNPYCIAPPVISRRRLRDLINLKYISSLYLSIRFSQQRLTRSQIALCQILSFLYQIVR